MTRRDQVAALAGMLLGFALGPAIVRAVAPAPASASVTLVVRDGHGDCVSVRVERTMPWIYWHSHRMVIAPAPGRCR